MPWCAYRYRGIPLSHRIKHLAVAQGQELLIKPPLGISPSVSVMMLTTLHSALQVLVEVQGPQEPTAGKGGRWVHPEWAPSAGRDGHKGPPPAQGARGAQVSLACEG